MIVRQSSLQKAGFDFRPEESVEQLVADFCKCHANLANHLPPCRHLVMRFFNGVLHFDSETPGNCRLILPPAVDEDPSRDDKQGFMIGRISTPTAGIVAGIVEANGKDDVKANGKDDGGVREGCSMGARMIEAHYQEGFIVVPRR